MDALSKLTYERLLADFIPGVAAIGCALVVAPESWKTAAGSALASVSSAPGADALSVVGPLVFVAAAFMVGLFVNALSWFYGGTLLSDAVDVRIMRTFLHGEALGPVSRYLSAAVKEEATLPVPDDVPGRGRRRFESLSYHYEEAFEFMGLGRLRDQRDYVRGLARGARGLTFVFFCAWCVEATSLALSGSVRTALALLGAMSLPAVFAVQGRRILTWAKGPRSAWMKDVVWALPYLALALPVAILTGPEKYEAQLAAALAVCVALSAEVSVKVGADQALMVFARTWRHALSLHRDKVPNSDKFYEDAFAFLHGLKASANPEGAVEAKRDD